MTAITPSDAQRIAELAHLYIAGDHLDEAAAGLGSILEFGTQLQDIDTSDVQPTSQVTGLTDVLREDVVRPSSVAPEVLVAAAPSHLDGYFKVKRVMK
jgi:aspartyl-tRNA(Asn)/glutamyl-tRNA(Gln) amidotransferase subunit C